MTRNRDRRSNPPSGGSRKSPRPAGTETKGRPAALAPQPPAQSRRLENPDERHEAVHQGLLLEARPLAPIDLADLPANGFVLVLDQIIDPHNVGAILRTGAAFAVDALVTTDRHSPDFAGALAKSASGGLEHVQICSVANLARALADMGDMGYWRIGLDSDAPVRLSDAAL